MSNVAQAGVYIYFMSDLSGKLYQTFLANLIKEVDLLILFWRKKDLGGKGF